MSEPISVEKKLELMQQIRSRHEQDQLDMTRRAQIIYGKDYQQPVSSPTINADPDADPGEASFLSLRILIALGLVLLVIISDLSGKTLWGVSTSECFNAISKDYESSITHWVNAASDAITETEYPDPAN